MTPEELAVVQREFLIRTEKRSAVVIFNEFERLKAAISDYLTTNLRGTITISKLEENSFLTQILDEIETQILRIKNPFTRIVTSGQQRIVNFASQTLNKFFEVKTSIFSPDREAIKILIGRTQTGTTLSKIFENMLPTVRAAAQKTLIESFSSGEPVGEIARRLSDVSDIGLRRALTISRTETNEAYRAASRDFYAEADIKEYVWLAKLDARTCLICWHLHGRKFKTSHKVFSHPNCRCVLVPKIKNAGEIPTGTELFQKLEKGVQKQILGAKRFEMFETGADFKSFVGSELSKEFGESFFVRNLSDFD